MKRPADWEENRLLDCGGEIGGLIGEEEGRERMGEGDIGGRSVNELPGGEEEGCTPSLPEKVCPFFT